MRLPRTSLLERLHEPDAARFAALEAPTGFGKSWLLRHAAGAVTARWRGELGPLADQSIAAGTTVIIDDAHLLPAAQSSRLAELIEYAPASSRLLTAGRILPDAIHAAIQLVDGAMLDVTVLALTPEEITAEVGDADVAEQMIDTADGSIQIIATALDQLRRDPGADPVAVTSRLVRATAAAAEQQLAPRDAAVVALVARAPGLPRHLLDKLAGPAFVPRALAAGVPLRRFVTGEIDVAMAPAFRTAPISPNAAADVADELVERGRAVDAIGLLLDAGAHDRATRMMMDLSESVTDTVEPRLLLGLLARLGSVIDREPALQLLRAAAARGIGQVDNAAADIDRAVALASSAPPPVRRRIAVEAARARLAEGRREDAVRAAEQALVDLGDGEDRTFARAHEVLAACAATSDARSDLQAADEHYRVAAAAWEGCGEFARARGCRRDLAVGVLVPLGRYDEALAVLGQLLAAADLSEAERSVTVLAEGFALYNANRLDRADACFIRVADIAYIHENPRLVAAAAWGRALVASRRGDLHATLRWIATAENTALTDADDVLGVPFLCDVATALGALGQLKMAARYLERATERRSVFPDLVASTTFLLNARRGVRNDLAEGLRCTTPAEWWRVYLLAAYAAARHGDRSEARDLLDEAEHELRALGVNDFAAVGEGATAEELQALLATPTGSSATGPDRRSPAAASRLLRVMGSGPMTIHTDDEVLVLPPGNPQRLVGVVVANGGVATFDQLSEAIWPGDDVEASRARLRNVLLRLRRVDENVVVRTAAGVRLAPGLRCDLHEFEQRASDALSVARADPELAGRLAAEALTFGDPMVFADFQYEDWASAARRATEQRLIGLLDLLSVQAEDAGDLVAAQSFAERALRLDRYTDSRYVRLAELLTLQDRVAAAIAVLDDAAEVARELGGALPPAIDQQRNDLLRRTASS